MWKALQLRKSSRPLVASLVTAALALTIVSNASAQSEERATVREIRVLGGTTAFVRPPLKAVDTFKHMGTDPKISADIRTVFAEAGLNELSSTVVATIATANTSVRGGRCSDATPVDGVIVECDVQPGETLHWMALRPKGRSQQPGLLRDVRWAGAKPFSAFLFRVTNAGRVYTFVVPKLCGNISLMSVEDVPRAAVVVPPPAPAPPPPPPAPAPEPTPAIVPPPPAPMPMVQAPAPPVAISSPFFVDALFGKDRRTRPIEGTDLDFAQCSPLFGLKVGVGKRFQNDWEVAGAVGLAVSLVRADDKVQEHALFADVELNKYLSGGAFLGTGLSMWDLNHSDTLTPALMLHAGVPLNGAAKIPVYFLVEGRLFFDHIDDIQNNYQFWGGLRVRF